MGSATRLVRDLRRYNPLYRGAGLLLTFSRTPWIITAGIQYPECGSHGMWRSGLPTFVKELPYLAIEADTISISARRPSFASKLQWPRIWDLKMKRAAQVG